MDLGVNVELLPEFGRSWTLGVEDCDFWTEVAAEERSVVVVLPSLAGVDEENCAELKAGESGPNVSSTLGFGGCDACVDGALPDCVAARD